MAKGESRGDSDVEMEVPDLDSPVALENLAPIAKPLAGKKLHKRLLKLVKRAAKEKSLKRGVKEVVKSVRKTAQAKGLVVLAGDISPVDVLSHVPVLCEDAGLPYVFVRSKADLGAAGATKRATCCLMVTAPGKGADAELSELYEKCVKEIKALHTEATSA